MPHQCVRCNTFYEDGAKEILAGCSCGARLFFFIRKDKLEKLQNQEVLQLPEAEAKRIEEDVLSIVGSEDKDAPVVLDIESIRVTKPGKYELDLVHLFKGEPLIFKIADGKYIIDVAETFRRMKKD